MESLQQSMDTMAQLFKKQMDNFHTELKKKEDPAPVTTSSLSAEFEAFRSFIVKALDTLQAQVSILAKEQDRLEMRGRRKILLFHGVKEQTSEDVLEVLVKVVSDNFKFPDFSIMDISRCHRMGRPTEKSRPILIKFKEGSVRDKLWVSKTSLKGTGITMSEFLTRERHIAFMEARQIFGISKCWTRDGWILVIGPDGKRHKITSVTELRSIQSPPGPSAPASTSNESSASAETKSTTSKLKRTTRK